MSIAITTTLDTLTSTVNGLDYNLSVEGLPTATVNKILAYGFQRLVNDRCGGKDKDDATKAKLATEMVAKCESGDWTRAESATVDPIERELSRMATDAVKRAAKAKGATLTDEKVDEIALAYGLKMRDEWLPIAIATVNARKASKAAKSFLDGIDLGV